MKLSLRVTLAFCIILVCFFSLENLFAQAQGPASGSISGGASVSTDDYPMMIMYGPGKPDNLEKKIHQRTNLCCGL